MKIHEYQGKEILRNFGVPVPRGYPAFTVLEAGEAAQAMKKARPGVSTDTTASGMERALPAIRYRVRPPARRSTVGAIAVLPSCLWKPA